MPTVIHPDPFNAVLLSSVPLAVTSEQGAYIKRVLDRACSDSRFAEKAYLAIWYILTAEPTVPPVITGLNPASVVLGSPNFTLHVMGTGFTPDSSIIWNGSPEPTTFVSETELTTEVDMSTAAVAVDIPVFVESGGVMSDAMTFSFTESAPLAAMAASAPAATKTTAVKK